MDWGPGRIHCDNVTTRDIETAGGTLHSSSTTSTDSDYVAVRDTRLPFYEIQAVPGRAATWAITLKPTGGGFEWRKRNSTGTEIHQFDEEFQITVHNKL
ncbi:MAG TPA: hypothetical protein PKE27_11535 [Povalibacter sp.]|uniref:hypothetical protein n=1 Tax=Povalibacter sp. TaxID=1962978 RepID=UPI002B9B5821|nr:hypothetical protein [Povalibacter sp.]HMN45202.1 hypothetical protein [Povalibacter sp.]